MFRGWIPQLGGTTTRALTALVVAAACFAAVAYAADQPPRSSGPSPQPLGPVPAQPHILKHPARVSTATTASFTFTAPAGLRFRCRLDRDRWKGCRSPALYPKLAAGSHSFAVRAVSRLGRPGPLAGFRWRLVEPRAFAIEPRISDIGALYPGAPALSLPVLLRNPNPVPIQVTGLRVTVTADPPGCDSANLALTPAGATSRAPLRLPAGGSLSLPSTTAAAPTIALRDLPVNQDACQGAHFPLSFSGEARG